jgi:hypothetical protein
MTNKGQHAIERARERYGLDLTAEDLDGMIADIAAGRAAALVDRLRALNAPIVSAMAPPATVTLAIRRH